MDKATFEQFISENETVIFFTPSDKAQKDFYNLAKTIDGIHYPNGDKITYNSMSKAMALSKDGILTHASLITLPYLGTKYRIIDFITGEQINKN